MMSRLVRTAVLLSALVSAGVSAESPGEALAQLQQTLSDAEANALLRPFSDSDRKAYRLTPGERGGLMLKNMDAETREAAFAFLASILSERGMAVLRGAIEREALLGTIEENPEYRHPDKYYLAVFVSPANPNWGVRFEGHHYSLNVTLNGSRIVAVTPFLLGANPKHLTVGKDDPLRPFLNAHEDPSAFLRAFQRMFKPDVSSAMEGAEVDTSGFGVFGHPHMEVSGRLDFGGR